ncbi:right-handed parallel beta-helix repeat-containing protein [Myxococcus landrumensis]|uniref:right-handed parallel beta-helix repeat-containing protein n=1 Tax=Myxococcus landrumensis TaxID=2813577 RepID=UPI001F50B7B8|nr:right-handed parallel beta-helix repeat-containing protein [Myxococcus landrumus]
MPTVALATNVPGGVLASDTTWTAAGNPWTIQGTLTIPVGVTLTLEPGVSVTTPDDTALNLEVLGSLVAVGTADDSINILLHGNSIRVRGTVVADHVFVVGGQPSFRVEGSGSATFNHSTLRSGAPSLDISGGSLNFENGFVGNCKQVMKTTGGTSTLRSSLIHDCTPTGTTPLIKISGSSPKVTLVHNSFFDNGGSAIDGFMNGGPTDVSITLYDNIIVGKGSYGLRLTNVLAPVVHHNVVWGFTDANYVGVSPGEGSVTANPLILGYGSLTENSPARNVASDGTDMGAVPYSGLPAHPVLLEGILRSNRTLTGDNVVTGDLLVPAGITLTLAPGASVMVKSWKDGPGESSVSLKVLIAGSLKAEGTVEAPVRFDHEYDYDVTTLQGQASFKHARVKGALTFWGSATFEEVTLEPSFSIVIKGTGSATFKGITGTGSGSIQLKDDSTATVENVTLSRASLYAEGNSTLTVKDATLTKGGVSVSDSATATVTDSHLTEGYPCLRVLGGSLTFERGTLEKCSSAVEATGGVVNVSYSLLRDNERSSPALVGGLHLANVSASIAHNTIINNKWGALYIATQPQNTVEIRDNIIKSNEYTGIEVVPASNISIHHNAVWGHSSNYKGNPTLGPGSLTQDPLFVSPRHLTLLETSPCRNSASDGTDMGAFPYVPVPGASIVLGGYSLTTSGNTKNSVSARVYDAEGLELPHAVVTWSATPEVGTIDADGVLTTGCTLGSYPGAMVARSGNASASVDVTVQLGSVQTVVVTPSQVTLRIEETQQFSAKGVDFCGYEVPTTFQWATGHTAAGRISASGLYTASSNVYSDAKGIQVTAGGKTGSASLNILPGPLHHLSLWPETVTMALNSSMDFFATPRDRAGNTLPGSVAWSVVGGGGTIDALGHFVAGSVAGSFPKTVQASFGGLTVAADVIVTPGWLHRVEVMSASNEVRTRGSIQFTAQGFDEWGNKRVGSPTWTVMNPALGTIDSNGLLKVGTVAGFFPGAVMARMTDGFGTEVTGLADVTVRPGPLSRLVLMPTLVTLEPQATQQFGVMGFDVDGNAVTLSPTWSVVTAGAGAITPEGLYTAPRVAGTYSNSVRVGAEHLTLTTTVFVKPAAVRRVEISPEAPAVVVKGTVPFQVKAFDAYDNEVTSASAAWSVVKGGGSISAAGVFTAGTVAGTFADSVQVTVEGVTKATGVTVTPGAVSRIAISPQGPTVAAGSTVAFSAKAFDAYGNEVTSAPATWKVVNGGGSIDGAGVFTAGIVVGAFPGTVQVTVGGVVEQASVSVVAAAPSRVVLSPQNPTIPAGGSVTFSAQAFDMYGNEAPAYPATWKVVNGGGTVNASGVFSAGTVAGTFLNTVQVTVGSATGTTSVSVTSTTPNPEPECRQSSDCGGGETCNAGVCEAPPTSGGKEGGGGCSSSGTGTSVFGLLVLVMLAFDSRKRRAAR